MDDTGFTIPSKLYNFLKWMALTVLPALAAMVLGLGLAIHWDGSEVTAAVITVVDTFLGTIIKKSASNYNDAQKFGDLVFSKDPDGGDDKLKLVAQQENVVFREGSKLYLDVKREQPIT